MSMLSSHDAVQARDITVLRHGTEVHFRTHLDQLICPSELLLKQPSQHAFARAATGSMRPLI